MCLGDFKGRDIALQSNQGMDLEAEISFFFGRAPPIICTIHTERTTIWEETITGRVYRKKLHATMPKALCLLLAEEK